MKDFLKKLISNKKGKIEELRSKIEKAETVDEVKNLTKEIEDLKTEVRSAEEQLSTMDIETRDNTSNFDPSKATNIETIETKTEERKTENVLESMEYRTAFMNYVLKDVKDPILEQRANAVGVSGDLGTLGAIIPLTVNPFILEELEKLQGTIYGKVRKTNLRGGVKYPLADFSGAVFHRITENTVSDRQKVGKVKEGIVFTYKIGEIRLARTLLQTVLTVDQFEREYAKVISRAYVDAMDNEIMRGVGDNNELEGILTEAKKSTNSRFIKSHIIEVPEDKIQDWTWWQENVFAEIPLNLEGAFSEFVMAKQTLEGTLKTMKDTTGQPIEVVGYNANEKQHTFNSITVSRCENTIFPSYSKADDGDYFAMLWNPTEAYVINSNMEFSVTDYFDHGTNQYVKKALVINDGKILDPHYIYLFKKKTVTPAEGS